MFELFSNTPVPFACALSLDGRCEINWAKLFEVIIFPFISYNIQKQKFLLLLSSDDIGTHNRCSRKTNLGCDARTVKFCYDLIAVMKCKIASLEEINKMLISDGHRGWVDL